MTASPEIITPPLSSNLPSPAEVDPLEALFNLGYATSAPKMIYKDDTFAIEVVFRTLTPPEMRDVYEASSQYGGLVAQTITERIETLARAIVTINHMPLILTAPEQQKFYVEKNRHPSPLEMAKVVLTEKIKSTSLIDALYEEYTEFSDKIANSFVDIKKKLKNPTSSSST